jgi:hypothetical protein
LIPSLTDKRKNAIGEVENNFPSPSTRDKFPFTFSPTSFILYTGRLTYEAFNNNEKHKTKKQIPGF